MLNAAASRLNMYLLDVTIERPGFVSRSSLYVQVVDSRDSLQNLNIIQKMSDQSAELTTGFNKS